jgi:hypothetical protein
MQYPMSVHSATRKLISKGHLPPLSTKGKQKTLHYFLFNDLLLITKPSGDKNKLVNMLDLMDAVFETQAQAGVASTTSSYNKEKSEALHNII